MTSSPCLWKLQAGERWPAYWPVWERTCHGNIIITPIGLYICMSAHGWLIWLHMKMMVGLWRRNMIPLPYFLGMIIWRKTQNFIQKSENIGNSTTTIHGCKVSLKVQMEEWARDKVTPGFGKVSVFCANINMLCKYQHFVQISIFCANINILFKYQYCV